MRLWPTNPFHPLTIVRGERCTVWDDTGKAYVDLLSGTWCNALGYATRGGSRPSATRSGG
jgi:adenosylmethionine-8-amino-7-oxononanoate aminotransferase